MINIHHMTSNTEDLTAEAVSPHKFTPMPGVHKCVDTEKPAGSRVLLAQHPRPSRFSGHDWRSGKKIKQQTMQGNKATRLVEPDLKACFDSMPVNEKHLI